MKTTMGKKLRYWLENFMARGGVAVFLNLLILFIIALVVTTIIRSFFVVINPEDDIITHFFNHFWRVFLGLIDPGTLAMEEGAYIWYYIAGIITILIGLIIFSMLIAFITTQVETLIYNFRKGKSQVIEERHTLILGWNERIFDVIRELSMANESEKNASIVILADKEKEEMDDAVSRQFSRIKSTRIITRAGDTSSLTQLRRVNAASAKSAVILSGCPDSSSGEMKEWSDTKTIKIILALLGCQEVDNRITIVAEIFSDEKRALLNSLKFNNVISINTWEILGKLLVQTSLSSGLELVYSEILSFQGCEIYTYKDDWGGIAFGDLVYHFSDGIPMGIKNSNGSIELRPPAERKLESGDSIFIIAEDDSTIQFRKQKLYTPEQFNLPEKKMKKVVEKELILGWHSIAEIVLREYAEYLPVGSSIDIMVHNPSDSVIDKINWFQSHLSGLEISLIRQNPLSRENLKNISPYSYDNIIILAQDESDYSPEKVDADTMLILLLLREIIKEEGIYKKNTKIITQILNSDNQELIEQSNVDDFIVSNKMITKIMAQISENSDIETLYNHIFAEKGSEIYLKPADLYFDALPADISFFNIISLVQQRNEICLGVRIGALSKNSLENFGLILNPKKNRQFVLDKGDYLVVLAESKL